MKHNQIKIYIDVHYFLLQDNVHQMDAKVFNECEKQLILAFEAFNPPQSEVNVEVVARKEGGVIGGLILTFISDITLDMFKDKVKDIIKNVIGKFFSKDEPNKKMSDAEVAQVWAQYKPLLEQGKMTQEEVEILAKGNKKLALLVSNFHKNALKESNITSISATATSQEEEIVKHKIERSYFSTKIIEDTSYQESETIEGVDIQIISPVLLVKHGEKWRGIYNTISIDFKILDKTFLQQVYNNEIKFGSITVIRCKLSILHIYNENGNEDESKRKYIVQEVYHWADDETLKFKDTKTYKKKQSDKRQMNIEFEE